MQNLHTKSEQKLIRKLSEMAWQRQLRDALKDLGDVISQMDAGNLSPSEANDAVHQFHNGISLKLYNRYSVSDPWLAVCRAYYDGVLKDDDFADASESIRDGLQQFADRFHEYNGIQESPSPQTGGFP